NAPLTVTLAQAQVRLGRDEVPAEIFGRVWDYGVVSIQFHIAIPPGTSWEELVHFAALAEGDNDFDELAVRRARELTAKLRAGAKSAREPRGVEDYVIYLLEKVQGVAAPADLLKAVDVAALILGEPNETISPAVRDSILGSVHSYSARDCAVIDWNSALLIEP